MPAGQDRYDPRQVCLPLARNTLDTISYTRELRSLGIAVIFEEQNINSIHPESEFLIALHRK